MANRFCFDCKADISKRHFNSKRCKECARFRRKRPSGKLTRSQERMVRRFAGKMFYEKLAVKVGSSRSNLMRWARDNNVSLDALSYKPSVIQAVTAYYEKHGKVETQKAFPNVRVRSIVERYKNFQPRQMRWTDDQIIELARMAGLVSMKSQAKYFKRPNAFEGSIKSAWMKKFGILGSSINGMSNCMARQLVTNECPRIKTFFWETRSKARGQYNRKICLWTDMKNHLRPEVPNFIGEAIVSLANFQTWLHGNNPKNKCLALMQEREAI